MSDSRQIVVNYRPPPTACALHSALGCDVRQMMGPIGSGKSTTACWDIMNLAMMVPPDDGGVRRVNTAFVRNTLPQLLETTKKTWRDWFGPDIYGKWYDERMSAPYKMWLRIPPGRNPFLADGTGLDLEISLMALDGPDAEQKLLSLELTNGWVNESREVESRIIKALMSRTGRFPHYVNFETLPKAVSGVIMDTNAPDTDSWLYQMFEEKRPSGWQLFRQPPAMVNTGTSRNPRWERNDGHLKGFQPAENIENIPARWGYYDKLVVAHDTAWLDVMVSGNYGSVTDGSPVFTEYQDAIHWADDDLTILSNVPLCLAWDFGRTPSCILMQMSRSGQVRIIREIIGTDISVFAFATQVVKPILVNEYDYHRLAWFGVGDPSGVNPGQERDETNFQILREAGLAADPCPTNLFKPRREAVAHFLRSLASDGKVGMLIGNRAPFCRKAFQGGYKYRTFAPGQQESSKYEPLKNEYSHPMDAVQYGCYVFKNGLYSGDGQSSQWGARQQTEATADVPMDMAGFL